MEVASDREGRRAIQRRSAAESVALIVFNFTWAEGCRPDVPGAMDRLGAVLGIEQAPLRAAMPEAKRALRSNTEEAISRGVFGVPTAMAHGELFWGLDSTDMLLDFLHDPVSFEDPEMRRVTELPTGIQRQAGRHDVK